MMIIILFAVILEGHGSSLGLKRLGVIKRGSFN